VSDADRYRLGPVRDARSREERVKRGDLAVAASVAVASQAQVDAAARRVDEAHAKLAAARGAHRAVASAGELARSELFIARMRRDLELATDAHARAEASHRGQADAVDAARRRLARARADKEVIERHFARWRTERAKLAERRED
jgi:hypothetical protein